MECNSAEKRNLHRGRPKQSLSSDLTSDLIELLRTSPSTKDKVIEFVETLCEFQSDEIQSDSEVTKDAIQQYFVIMVEPEGASIFQLGHRSIPLALTSLIMYKFGI